MLRIGKKIIVLCLVKKLTRLGTVKQGSGHESLRMLIFAVFSKLLLFQIHLSNLPEAELGLLSQLSTLTTYIYNTCIHEVAELVGCCWLSVQWICLVGVVVGEGLWFLKTEFKSKDLSRCYSLHGKDHVRYMAGSNYQQI